MNPKTIVYGVLGTHFGIDTYNEGDTLDLLGFDSLDQVELMMQLEEATGRDFGTDAGFNGATTVRDLINLVSGSAIAEEDTCPIGQEGKDKNKEPD